MPQIVDMRWAVLNSAASGSITVITGTAGSPMKIWQVLANSVTATTLTFGDGSTALSGPVALGATSSLVLPYTGAPWFYVAPGDNFTITNGSAVQISGTIYYTLG